MTSTENLFKQALDYIKNLPPDGTRVISQGIQKASQLITKQN